MLLCEVTPTWNRGPGGSGCAGKSTDRSGWSTSPSPTPARSATTSIPSDTSAVAGPMPERIRISGVPYAPAASTISLASIVSAGCATRIPVARPLRHTIRSASRFGRMVRFGRPRASHEVRQRGAHPHAVEGRERDHAGTDRPGAVVICDLRITDRGGRRQRRRVRGPDLVASVTTYRERPAATMPGLLGVVEVVLGRLERGQHLVKRPAGVAERHPRVVVGRRPPQGEGGVRRRAAADEASAGELDRSTRRVRLARQPPVVASGGHPRVCDIRGEVVARRVVGTRLEQQDAALARFAESCR